MRIDDAFSPPEGSGLGSGGRPRKAALLLNGGGISAASWEVGCLAALDTAFGQGFCARYFDMYLGVSAGSIVAALAAGGVRPASLRRDIINDREGGFNFQRANVYGIDYWRVAPLCWDAMRRFTGVLAGYRRDGVDFSFFDLIDVMQELLPSGLFSLSPLQKYLETVFTREELPDRFLDLDRTLFIPAIDLDRGERVVFGEPGRDDMRVSDAITASCAIPAFFRPYQIGERSFIDGCMGGYCHLDVAVQHGASLIVIVNPLVPFQSDPNEPILPSAATGAPCTVAELGISFVGDQALRILSRERLGAALELCRHAHPDVEILLLEPDRQDPLLFVNGPMSFQARGRILEHGYDTTLVDLENNKDQYRQLFERHGDPNAPEVLTGLPPAHGSTGVGADSGGRPGAMR